MYFKYFLYWLPLPVIAIINGIIRQLIYHQFMGNLSAHQLSTLSGLILFSIYIWLLSTKWSINSGRQAFAMGITWLVITMFFEFIFGHYIMNNPWKVLIHDYNLLEGRLWSLILVWTVFAPYLAFRLRK
jgi:hypothetical protein